MKSDLNSFISGSRQFFYRDTLLFFFFFFRFINLSSRNFYQTGAFPNPCFQFTMLSKMCTGIKVGCHVFYPGCLKWKFMNKFSTPLCHFSLVLVLNFSKRKLLIKVVFITKIKNAHHSMTNLALSQFCLLWREIVFWANSSPWQLYQEINSTGAKFANWQ